ncbi:MAG: hypothetical protein CUN55_04605 [Phototrophicales bacterium]|nr:MAG: hypothetical protein CUN55_04605 [Phototrophicales bacterium]
MPKVVWNGVVLAESDHVERVEGNYYFPPDSVNMEYFTMTDLHTTCPWKGVASYYTVEVNGERLENVAWTYLDPKPAAANIKEHIAFYRKVDILDD